MTRQGLALRQASLAYLTGQSSPLPRPVAVGEKFTPTGKVMPFAGNTFLCHIPLDSVAHAALTEASAAFQEGPIAGAFAFLPPSSFHMTVFEGVCDAHRDGDRWPEGLDRSLPVTEVTRHFLQSVAGTAFPSAFRICPTGIFGGFSVAVSGLDDASEHSLRAARYRLRDLTGIRRTDFDSYDFHITLAYLLRWLTPVEAVQVLDLSEQVFDRLKERAPVIELGRIEFCKFNDMLAFPRIRPLL